MLTHVQTPFLGTPLVPLKFWARFDASLQLERTSPWGLPRAFLTLGTGARVLLPPSTANLRTKILDFRGFDSSRILILKRGILMSKGISPENLSQAILLGLLGRVLGRLGVGPASQDSDLLTF